MNITSPGAGFGTVWTVKAGAAFATPYTNNTGLYRDVIVSGTLASMSTGESATLTAVVGGVSLPARVFESGHNVNTQTFVVVFTVPPGATYQVNATGVPTAPSIGVWMELL